MKIKRFQGKVNVVLITPDQMRADHLHCYGYFRKTSPCIDALANEGTFFKRHFSVASWTIPSFVSIHSSLVPSQHRMTLHMYGSGITIKPSNSLLSEQFKIAGYKTAAFTINTWIGRWLLGRGFDEHYEALRSDEYAIKRKAEEANETIFKWLDQHYKGPFFVWMQYMEPHSPYNPPPEHDIFRTSAYPDEINTGYTPERNKGYLFHLATAGDRKAVERLNSLYDGKIHYVDYHIGRLLKKLEELGLDENTLVVLISDHGELLYDHVDCLTFDHISLYDSVVHVPFIMRGPFVPEGKVIDAMVSTLDVAPTILDIAGLLPIKGAQGKSLLPLVDGRLDAVHEYIFAEQDILERLRSVRDGQYKLIYHLEDGGKQLFNTIKDHMEKKDIAEQVPSVLRALSAQLLDYISKNEPSEKERLRIWRKVSNQKLGVIIDELTTSAQFQFFGMDYDTIESWVKGSYGGNSYQNGCYWIKPGDGKIGALWRSRVPLLGVYNIYLWYGELSNKRTATNAHFIVVTRGGDHEFIIDQNKNAGKWNLLGKFKDPLYVKLTNKADGPIIFDAIKFELIEV